MSKPLRIVAIDDDELDLMILRRHLEKVQGWAIRFSAISNPDAGTLPEALSGTEADLIFLDYSLGRDNAPEFLQRFKSLEEERPIVVLTGHDSPAITQETLRAGARCCLQKQGLNPQLLEKTLAQILFSES